MRDQLNKIISSLPAGYPAEAAANLARFTEARMLGLPLPGPLAPRRTTTNSAGSFAFRNLSPGRYEINASHAGYFAPPQGIVDNSPVLRAGVTVVAGQATTPISIELLRGAVVTGKVRDPNGQPLQSGTVSAYQIAYENGRKVLRSINFQRIDDRGQYRLFALPPGDYIIGVAYDRSVETSYYPSAVDARLANVVHVAEGEEATDIDVRVHASDTGRISGRIAVSGQPDVAFGYYLLSIDPAILTPSMIRTFPNSSSNLAGGRFELRGIPPGTYDLMAEVPQIGGTVWGRTRVSVVPGDLNDVTLNIGPGVEVKVRLSVDGGVPAYNMLPPPDSRPVFVNGGVTIERPDPTVLVPRPTYHPYLRSAEGLGFPASQFESDANQGMTFDPSGVFVYPHVPAGKYVLEMEALPPNGYIEDVKAGGTSVFDSGIDIRNQNAEIQILINTNGGRVQGTVLDAAGKPAAAHVALVPRESRRQNLALYKDAPSDASGKFNMDGIEPGDYKLFAWEAAPNGAWMNAEFLARYEGRGVAVSVTATGSTPASPELRVIPRDSERR
jgi:hypothetical protein